MPFTPKFVDLVRNFTTVQGTGPVALGAAVNGYTSLSEAAVAGEQFYYCLQGVDKPAEREVGRGTMQANGTVARDPVSGTPTNFTSGTKTIALVAAAEWFTRFEAGAAGAAGSIEVASRSALASKSVPTAAPAMLMEPGREGLFVFSAQDHSARVAADGAQGLHVAPASDPDGSSGAWVRKFDGFVDVRWFGAKGDNSTDDGPAFLAAIACLKSLAVAGFGYSKGSTRLRVPTGIYYLGTTTLELTHTLIVEGDGGPGDGGGPATVLRWAANTTGIRVQTHNTAGATGVRASQPTDRGDSSTIRNLFLKGAYAGSEGEFHGIQLRGRASIRDCYVSGFQGDGIHIAATAGGGAGSEGNANNFEVTKVWIDGCRNGLYVEGADANAGTVTALNANYNRQWGIWDSSFLGNSYTGCHTAGNSDNNAPGQRTTVSHGGNRYFVRDGQAAGASTNPPTGAATSNSWWGFVEGGGPAANIPAWTSGMTVREGGAYKTDNANARSVFVGCYSEGSQPPSQFAAPAVVLSGLHGSGTQDYGGHLDTYFNGQLWAKGGLRVETDLDVGDDLAVGGDLTVTGTTFANGNLTVSGALNVVNATTSFGPNSGAATDSGFYLNNTNYNGFFYFRSWDAGVPQVDGFLRGFRGWGLFLNGSNVVRFQVADAEIANVTAAGIDLAAGKVVKVAGTQVVGGRGAAVADATDAASAITQLNALLARCRAHGLIAS